MTPRPPPRTGRIVREPLDPQDAPTETFDDAPIRAAWGGAVRRTPTSTLRFERAPDAIRGVRYRPREAPPPDEEAPTGAPSARWRTGAGGCALVGAWFVGVGMGAAAMAAALWAL